MFLGMDPEQILDIGGTRRQLLHVAVQRQEILPDGRGQRAEASLVLRVAPSSVVKRRRGVEKEAGLTAHTSSPRKRPRQLTPTGVVSEAIRSWIDRTSRRRALSAISASHAAEVADIVVR
jgi:uncharacterized protein YjiS (DUF1127 family)